MSGPDPVMAESFMFHVPHHRPGAAAISRDPAGRVRAEGGLFCRPGNCVALAVAELAVCPGFPGAGAAGTGR